MQLQTSPRLRFSNLISTTNRTPGAHNKAEITFAHRNTISHSELLSCGKSLDIDAEPLQRVRTISKSFETTGASDITQFVVVSCRSEHISDAGGILVELWILFILSFIISSHPSFTFVSRHTEDLNPQKQGLRFHLGRINQAEAWPSPVLSYILRGKTNCSVLTHSLLVKTGFWPPLQRRSASVRHCENCLNQLSMHIFKSELMFKQSWYDDVSAVSWVFVRPMQTLCECTVATSHMEDTWAYITAFIGHSGRAIQGLSRHSVHFPHTRSHYLCCDDTKLRSHVARGFIPAARY